MIKKLQTALSVLVRAELAQARADNGERFNSDHEAVAVLYEEIEESREELEKVAALLTHAAAAQLLITGDLRRIWADNVRADVKVDNRRLEAIEEHAVDAAAEFVQVAAMARKWREGNV